jgi:DHA2 family multidrug resistance protein
MVMSFSDVFLALTALFVALGCSAFLMKRPNFAGGGGGGH